MAMDTKLPFDPGTLTGISDKTIMIHADKLYQGYVKKKKEIQDKLAGLSADDLTSANQSFSALRALKDGETFSVNGVYLHEFYFSALGGAGEPTGALVEEIKKVYGWDQFVAAFSACGMAARGWVILAWDTREGRLRIYTADVHNQGGVWGCIPLLVLDVYEHAYFIDYGADRKAYITDWWKNLNWSAADAIYTKVQGMKFDLPM
ncbi:MAG: Fe-Mn family superoxide dismutase [Patescibacteria group bacterium]